MPRLHPTTTRTEAPSGALAGRWGTIESLGLAGVALVTCLGHYLAVLFGRDRLDLPALAFALRQSGLSMLPVITLTSVVVGIILGRQTEGVLAQFDLPSLVLLSLTYTVVIELVPVLVGILVAGRGGVYLAVRQASLISSGEVDGLLLAGIDPIRFLAAPMLLAMLLMSFAFVVWAALVTFAAAYLWLWLTVDLPPALFIDSLTRALDTRDLIEVIAKPLLFALVIALIAVVAGTAAGRDSEAIGDAATRTMIGAVTAILVVDLAVILLTRG